MPSAAQVFSANLLAALSELEVEEVFLAPGSRSQSLAIAAQQLHDANRLVLRVRIDERSMAFTALGAAKASGRPVAIITTSGTAVANLLPAVLEASHSGVPLILLTADRPAELRGVGANQTTNQVGIFGDSVRACIDVEAPTEPVDTNFVKALAEQAVATALGINQDSPGPVQLNLCFREPLSSAEPNASDLHPGAKLLEKETPQPTFAILSGEKNTILVAGAEAGLEALEGAEAFGWPIFAEPSSRCRVGANAIVGYPVLLEEEKDLIARKDIELVVIKSKLMGPFNPYGNAKEIADEITVNGEVSSDWLVRWRVAAHNWLSVQETSKSLDRRKIIETVYNVSEIDDTIVLGASRMIREADTWAPVKAIQVFSNRGLSGIDGTIATATGIALGGEGSYTRAIIGDLTLLHDASSMIEDSEEDLNLQLIMVNDQGGSLFEKLEVRKVVEEAVFDRVFRAGQKVDYWSLANAYGFSYFCPTNEAELRNALATKGRVLIEVKL
jgi:2-succinyl-5-enolpyruvyl-6-hydroxy-3-cyclohexene-1-carboxylate synthase